MTASCTYLTSTDLVALAAGESGTASARRHVARCRHCAQRLERFRAARASLAWLARRSGADLRGRILGAARDQAWRALCRRLGALLGLCKGSDDERARQWAPLADESRRLARRLRGLGLHVDLDELPGSGSDRTPAELRAALAPWAWLAHTDDAWGREAESEAADYQPSAAPSFLDSLAPQ